MRRFAPAIVLLAIVLASCSTTTTTTREPAGPPPAATTAPARSITTTAPASTSPATPAAGAKPVAAVNPCAANRKRKAVLVRLSEQHLWLCARGALVRDSPITSGMKGQYTETPTGRYTIQGRTKNTSLTLANGESFTVKYWIPFDAPLFGFHDSSWQKFPYGSAKYEKHGSHGCVHLPLKTIAYLYRWADVGTSVRIRS